MAFADILQQYRDKYDMLQGDMGGVSQEKAAAKEEVEEKQDMPEEMDAAMKYLQDFGMAKSASAPEQGAPGQFSQEELSAFEEELNNDPIFKKHGKKFYDMLNRLVDQIKDEDDVMDQQTALQVFAEAIEELK